jgi:ubiquinone/menaquinone biosynthesis C-methylase UbiE
MLPGSNSDNKHAFSNPTEYRNASNFQYVYAIEMLKKAGIKPTDRILDIGCGDGKITAYLANTATSGLVVGTDISQDMIDYARKEYTQKYDNLGFMVMDAKKNIFKKQFDIVVSSFCLHWVRDQLKALIGIKESLVENGKMFIILCSGIAEMQYCIDSVINNSKWREYFNEFHDPRCTFTEEEYCRLLSTRSSSSKNGDFFGFSCASRAH